LRMDGWRAAWAALVTVGAAEAVSVGATPGALAVASAAVGCATAAMFGWRAATRYGRTRVAAAAGVLAAVAALAAGLWPEAEWIALALALLAVAVAAGRVALRPSTELPGRGMSAARPARP